jgi:hypothetical protein
VILGFGPASIESEKVQTDVALMVAEAARPYYPERAAKIVDGIEKGRRPIDIMREEMATARKAAVS